VFDVLLEMLQSAKTKTPDDLLDDDAHSPLEM